MLKDADLKKSVWLMIVCVCVFLHWLCEWSICNMGIFQVHGIADMYKQLEQGRDGIFLSNN